MEKLTIDKIAEMAYVSRSVVSRVLNDHPNVSDEARARVQEVIDKHNYRPSSVARSLAMDRTFEICVLAPRWRWGTLGEGYWSLLHSAIFERCFERGYLASLSPVSSKIEQEVNERILNDRRYDGYILVTQDVLPHVKEALDAKAPPMVVIGDAPGHTNIHSIDVDNVRGGYQAGHHLRELGHCQVGAILGGANLKETTDRKKGFERAFAEGGRALNDRWLVSGEYTQECGYETMGRWIASEEVPTAVFCGSDTIAMGVFRALYEGGLRVPDDVAVVGFDDLPMSKYLVPPLTTVHQPIYQKGLLAADIVVDEIEGQDPSRREKADLATKIVIRESCGAVRRN